MKGLPNSLKERTSSWYLYGKCNFTPECKPFISNLQATKLRENPSLKISLSLFSSNFSPKFVSIILLFSKLKNMNLCKFISEFGHSLVLQVCTAINVTTQVFKSVILCFRIVKTSIND